MNFIGIPIGFYGYLFPGNINLMVLELYHSKKYRVLWFMLGLILMFESIYCIVSLVFLTNIKSTGRFYTTIESASYGLIFIMGLWMLLEKRNNKHASHQNTILRGILNIIIHPQQIPFWLIMGILVNRLVDFSMNDGALIAFVFFNAIGTSLAMLIYMVLGRKIMNYFKLNIIHINKVMGSIYILMSLYYLFSL